MSPEQVFEAALALSLEKREELIVVLEQTLDAPAIDDEYHAELERRLTDMKNGIAPGRPLDDVIRAARKRLP